MATATTVFKFDRTSLAAIKALTRAIERQNRLRIVGLRLTPEQLAQMEREGGENSGTD